MGNLCSSSPVNMDAVNKAVARATGMPAIATIPRKMKKDEGAINKGIKKSGKHTYSGHEFTSASKREEILKAVAVNIAAQAVGDELVDELYSEIKPEIEDAAPNSAARSMMCSSAKAALKKGAKRAAAEAAEKAVEQLLKEPTPTGEEAEE